MKIIDFHTHCFPDKIAHNAISALASAAHLEPAYYGKTTELAASMKETDIFRSVVLSIATNPAQTPKVNDFAISINQGRFIAAGSVHPEFEDYKGEIDRLKANGIKILKFHPEYQQFHVDEERMLPIYEYAAKSGLLMVFHAGGDLGFEPPFHSSPKQFAKVAGLLPEAIFVLAHMGGFQMEKEADALIDYKNLYLDTSFCLSDYYLQKEGGSILTTQAEHFSGGPFFDITEAVGHRRILFGSDAPWAKQKDYVRIFDLLPLPDAKKQAILYDNAADLLR